MSPKHNDINSIVRKLGQWRLKSDRIVFTNGCFDIIHIGHIQTLSEAKKLGNKLIVGINSDASVARLKGSERPINEETNRMKLIAALACVDAVILFEEDTPINLISLIQPDVLVKGGDWKTDQIVGGDLVEKNGGQVISVPFLEGQSSTNLLKKIQEL